MRIDGDGWLQYLHSNCRVVQTLCPHLRSSLRLVKKRDEIAGMEITTHTRDQLVLEDKRWLSKVFIIAFAGAGCLLTLSSIREYGIQGWYRMTHWMGVVMGAGGILLYSSLIFNLRLEISRVHGKGTLSMLKGFSWKEVASFELSELSELKIERQTIGHRQGYRLLANIKGDWVPLQQAFSHDYSAVEQAGKALQVILD